MRKIKRQILCTISLLVVVPINPLEAQNIERWGIGYKAVGGYLWAHKGNVDNLSAHTYGGSIEFRYRTANKKQWHRIYNRPIWGVRLYYSYLGNPNILGAAYGILPYAELPIIRKKYWEINFRGTAGLGYITNPFNLETNTINRTIGSHFNGNISVHSSLNIFLSKNLELNLVGGLTHFSNGNFRMPNLGINLPDISVGFSHYFGKNEVEEVKPDNFFTEKDEYYFTFALGRKNTDYIFSHYVIPFSLQFKYLRRLSPTSQLGGGVDYFYDEGNFFIDNKTGNSQEKGFAKATELALKISHEAKLNFITFMTDWGVYLYNQNHVKGLFYNRIGLRFQLMPEISVHTALKSHFARADYFEWGINYHIRKN